MPGKTSTRRKPKQNSEEIEDARLTQANGHQDDVSDDDQPRVKREKRNKGKQRAVEPEMDDAEGDGGAGSDDDSDEDDRIDVANFADRPLRREHLARLKGISQDWESMRKQISQRCEIYKDVATAMAEGGEADIQSSKVCVKSVTLIFRTRRSQRCSRLLRNWMMVSRSLLISGWKWQLIPKLLTQFTRKWLVAT